MQYEFIVVYFVINVYNVFFQSLLEQVANLLCAQVNSASYPQQYGK